MDYAKLIPQFFFDLLARMVPGGVLLGSWIFLIGQDQWSRLLNALLGGYLESGNAVPTATLAFGFVSFVLGHVLAPIAKWVERLNEWPVQGKVAKAPVSGTSAPTQWSVDARPEIRATEAAATKPPSGVVRLKKRAHFWVDKDERAGEAYDWLRTHHPDQGALCARIRAEFLMYDALFVVFLVVTGMTVFVGSTGPAVVPFLAAFLMLYRGAETEGTYQKTTLKIRRTIDEPQGRSHQEPALDGAIDS
jgi:hypothetical protein